MTHPRATPTTPKDATDLRSSRRDRGLSVPALADATGVADSVIRRAERGVVPRDANAKRIADYFGVRVSDLWPDTTTDEETPAALERPGV